MPDQPWRRHLKAEGEPDRAPASATPRNDAELGEVLRSARLTVAAELGRERDPLAMSRWVDALSALDRLLVARATPEGGDGSMVLRVAPLPSTTLEVLLVAIDAFIAGHPEVDTLALSDAADAARASTLMCADARPVYMPPMDIEPEPAPVHMEGDGAEPAPVEWQGDHPDEPNRWDIATRPPRRGLGDMGFME